MRILDPYYVLTLSIIILGNLFLLYMKLFLKSNNFMNISIYGSNIEALLLAYYLRQIPEIHLNLTLIGSVNSEINKYIWPSSEYNLNTIHSTYIERKILQFCGEQILLMSFLQDLHLQYKIKRSETLFSEQLSISTQEQFNHYVYRINQEDQNINTILDYGLSHLTAITYFNSFYDHLKNQINYETIQERSMKGILNLLLPFQEKLHPNGIEYLSQYIGLDQQYIRDYVNPTISGSYQHSVNSIATLFKLLPLYCPKYDNTIGSKSLVLLFDEKILCAKLLRKLNQNSHDLFHIQNKTLVDFKKNQNQKLQLSLTDDFESTNIQTDLLVILEDYENQNEKQISYYKTIVDGILHNDRQYEEVYTIYFKNKNIVSLTRLCSNDCKNFRNNVYLVISKNKLNQKDLTMFVDHQIISYRKSWTPKSHIPSSYMKFQQTSNVYRITDPEIISDSYELKLLIIKNMVNIIKYRYQQFDN